MVSATDFAKVRWAYVGETTPDPTGLGWVRVSGSRPSKHAGLVAGCVRCADALQG
jgi:hypothetical protein